MTRAAPVFSFMLLALLATTALLAQSALPSTRAIEARARAHIEAYDRAQARFRTALRDARDDSARQAALRGRPHVLASARAVWEELRAARPDAKGKIDDRLADETLWCIRQAPRDPVGAAALKRALAQHLRSPALAELPRIILLQGHPRDREILRRLSGSPEASVSGEAVLALSKLLAQEREGRTEAERLLVRILRAPATATGSSPPDPRSIRRRAAARLFALRHLVPGALAPSLTGRDLKGKPISLAEFRGRVVLLEFWGDW